MRFQGWRHACVRALAVCFSLALGQAAWAGQWQRVQVPGARCGDGLPYSIFVRKGDPGKVIFNLMGGGACWDFATCFGPTPLTWLHPIPHPIEAGGMLSDDRAISPVAGYTAVHFPYCTGDVHAGTHVALYGPARVHHEGANNFRNVTLNLEELTGIRLDGVSDFVLYGASAGGIGALYHSGWMDRLLPQGARKTLISDAPGLHFGKAFWKKFTPEMMDDFSRAMQSVGYSLDPSNGRLADLIPTVCRSLPGWNVGVLQGSQDVVMSAVFGAVTPWEHERIIYGDSGVFDLTLDPADNCAAWVPSTPMHTFLVTTVSSSVKAAGRTAMDFARALISDGAGRNYR